MQTEVGLVRQAEGRGVTGKSYNIKWKAGWHFELVCTGPRQGKGHQSRGSLICLPLADSLSK